jgi:O-glycosyl hydrolase
MLACLLLCSTHSRAANVTIDPATSYQTIDGFGGFGGMIAEYDNGAQATDAWVDLMVNDLGLTIHRTFLNPNDLEPVNDNADPFSTNLSAFNVAGGRMGTIIPLISKLHTAGVANFFFTILSPPYWQKQAPFNATCYSGGDCSCCGGTLRTDMYDEFAEFCAAYVRIARDQAGVDVHALSVQNEPRFSEPYPACVYSAAQLRDAVKSVGGRLASEGLGATRLMVAEDVLTNFGSLEGTVVADTGARKYVGVLATHAYSDGGVGTVPNSQLATLWSNAARRATQVNLPLWMTETSGYENSWAGCLTMVQGLYAALKFGKVSGWAYYRLGGSDDALTLNGQPTSLYYGCKQYFRYVRPGAVSVKAASSDADVLTLAFWHRADRTLTVVLVNQGAAAAQATLLGASLPSFTAFRTSASEHCENKGSVTPASVALPAGSVTTLYATAYDGPSSQAGSGPAARLVLGRSTTSPASTALYNLRGERVGTAAGAGAARLVIQCRRVDKNTSQATVVPLLAR